MYETQVENRRYGKIEMQEPPRFEAGSMATLTLTYTAGPFGIDDTGGIKISWMNPSDFSTPQMDDPTLPNYTSVRASNGADLQVMFNRRLNRRPWANTLYIRVQRGFLSEGDTITVTFGDRTQGSPGHRVQTNAEKRFQLKVFADIFATYSWEEVPGNPVIEFSPGPASFYRVIGPTLRKPASPSALAVVPTDGWGNPTGFPDETFSLHGTPAIKGLPVTIDGGQHDGPLVIEGLCAREPGDHGFQLLQADEPLAESGPLRVSGDFRHSHFWGDLHGQSEETVGSRSAEEYFKFARDQAFVDVTAHQGNDFQITDAFWASLQDLCDTLNEDGSFVVLPGYEWSGNTGVGGDRNVLFRKSGAEILRSSRALLTPGESRGRVVETVEELHRALDPQETVVIPHVGGRYANIFRSQSPELERSVEIHSTWGTFEWLLHDAFDLGQRVGIICHSDDHKGRPGAAYPGAKQFGAMGGLTCYLAQELTRDAIFDALVNRRHYGTTGSRMFIDVQATADAPIHAIGDGTPGTALPSAGMGDIVTTTGDFADFRFDILTQSPIERITIFRGKSAVEVIRPDRNKWSGRRIRVLGEGAAFRGRGREVPWNGTVSFDDVTIRSAEYVNVFRVGQAPQVTGGQSVQFSTVTTGNFSGVDIELDRPAEGMLRIRTEQVSADVDCATLSPENDIWLDAGGVGRGVRVVAMSDQLDCRSFQGACRIALEEGDTPVYLRVTTEDGHQAWTSPIYFCREQPGQ